MLRLSPAALAQTDCGKILTHITVDVARTRMFWHELRDFLYCVLTVSVDGDARCLSLCVRSVCVYDRIVAR